MTVMSKIESVAGYRFRQEDKLFFDANIWIYLYAPTNPSHRAVKIYSEMFKRILDVQCTLFIDVLIVSEIVNRLARVKWNRRKQPVFKNYRSSAAFRNEAVRIAARVKEMVNHCVKVESCFSSIDVDGLLDAYGSGAYDLNDQVIAEICKRHGLNLVTHDGDFRGADVTILTANKRLLKSG